MYIVVHAFIQIIRIRSDLYRVVSAIKIILSMIFWFKDCSLELLNIQRHTVSVVDIPFFKGANGIFSGKKFREL